MFNSETKTTLEFFKFLDDKRIFLFELDITRTVLLSTKLKLDKKLLYERVLGFSKIKSSNIIIFLSFALCERADLRAIRLTFLFILKL